MQVNWLNSKKGSPVFYPNKLPIEHQLHSICSTFLNKRIALAANIFFEVKFSVL